MIVPIVAGGAGCARTYAVDRTCMSAAVPDVLMSGDAAPAVAETRLPVGRRKRAHDVADKLEALIASDDEFGDVSHVASEREIMALFGVDRSDVSEALFMLQQQGRIEIGTGARALVISPTP